MSSPDHQERKRHVQFCMTMDTIHAVCLCPARSTDSPSPATWACSTVSLLGGSYLCREELYVCIYPKLALLSWCQSRSLRLWLSFKWDVLQSKFRLKFCLLRLSCKVWPCQSKMLPWLQTSASCTICWRRARRLGMSHNCPAVWIGCLMVAPTSSSIDNATVPSSINFAPLLLMLQPNVGTSLSILLKSISQLLLLRLDCLVLYSICTGCNPHMLCHE